jgi:hypothetical protein
VEDDSAPGVDSTCRVPDCAVIAVSPFLLVLLVSCFNYHSGVVANCDHTSEWVNWVWACIRITMRWVTLRKSVLACLLPVGKMQFSLD